MHCLPAIAAVDIMKLHDVLMPKHLDTKLSSAFIVLERLVLPLYEVGCAHAKPGFASLRWIGRQGGRGKERQSSDPRVVAYWHSLVQKGPVCATPV